MTDFTHQILQKQDPNNFLRLDKTATLCQCMIIMLRLQNTAVNFIIAFKCYFFTSYTSVIKEKNKRHSDYLIFLPKMFKCNRNMKVVDKQSVRYYSIV